jgi:hypothetical protein
LRFNPSTDYEKTCQSAEYDSGNYLKAIEYTDMYLKDNPHDVKQFCLKIDAFIQLGKYEKLYRYVMNLKQYLRKMKITIIT